MRRRLAQFLAITALFLGLGELFAWRKGPQQPKWLQALGPIRSCPIPQGQEVWVLLPPHFSRTQADWVLMELFWQQEKVRWRLPRATGAPHGWVLAAPGLVPPGISLWWQREGWTLGWVSR